MEKKCTKCLNLFPESDQYFNYRNKDKQILSNHCKTCAKEATKQHYAKNPKKVIRRVQKWRREQEKIAKNMQIRAAELAQTEKPAAPANLETV